MRKKLFLTVISLFLGAGIAVLTINLYIITTGSRFIISAKNVAPAQTILILGAAVSSDGRLSDMYHDRAEVALDLFNAGKAPVILVSGDNSTKNYDEVTPVKNYLEGAGVPTSSIVLDYAGFDTYDSLYRARDIFGVTSTIIVTQGFHLPRALYLGNSLGISVKGVSADLRSYRGVITHSYLREWGARVKAWFNIILRSKPKFLGPTVSLQKK